MVAWVSAMESAASIMMMAGLAGFIPVSPALVI
jgi:hypothetical protein